MSVEPTWFTSLDKPMTTKNKDTLIEALSSWITEIGEIDQTFTERRSDLKSFMTSEKDTKAVCQRANDKSENNFDLRNNE